MKKVRIFPLLMSLCMVLSLAACGGQKTVEDDGAKESTVQMNEKEDASDFSGDENITTEPSSGNGNTNEGQVFFYNKIDWSGLSAGTFDGTMYPMNLKGPFELTAIDEFCAPYWWAPSGFNSRTASSIEEVITSTETMSVDTIIRTQDDKEFNEKNDGIDKIHIHNFVKDSEHLPVSTCYENGWWSIESSLTALGIPLDEIYEEDDDYQLKRMEAVLERMGKPSYIMVNSWDTSFEKTAAANEMGLHYYLVYEFEGYVININITEFILQGYSSDQLKIHGFTYYTEECWEQYKDQYREVSVK